MAAKVNIAEGFVTLKSAGFASVNRDMRAAGTGFRNFSRTVRTGTTSIMAALGPLLAAFAALKAATAAFRFVSFGISRAADLEAAELALTTMLGSAEKAGKLLDEVRKFAAETPFEQPEIITATKQFVAYGFAADEIIETLTDLGDISAGLNVPLGELTELFGKSKVEGVAFTQDLRQFMGRGINVVKELAKQFGVTERAIFDMASNGQIQFKHLNIALRNLSRQQFGGLMVKQSQTLKGLWSTFKDLVGEIGESFGQVFMPALKGILRFMSAIAERMKGIAAAVKTFDLGAIKKAFVDAFADLRGPFDALLAFWREGIALLAAGLKLKFLEAWHAIVTEIESSLVKLVANLSKTGLGRALGVELEDAGRLSAGFRGGRFDRIDAIYDAGQAFEDQTERVATAMAGVVLAFEQFAGAVKGEAGKRPLLKLTQKPGEFLAGLFGKGGGLFGGVGDIAGGIGKFLGAGVKGAAKGLNVLDLFNPVKQHARFSGIEDFSQRIQEALAVDKTEKELVEANKKLEAQKAFQKRIAEGVDALVVIGRRAGVFFNQGAADGVD